MTVRRPGPSRGDPIVPPLHCRTRSAPPKIGIAGGFDSIPVLLRKGFGGPMRTGDPKIGFSQALVRARSWSAGNLHIPRHKADVRRPYNQIAGIHQFARIYFPTKSAGQQALANGF
ncbi:hypothetical protein NXT3_PB00205 (plasmid) [Sinorhizobium fredii]|uniref:Uncharacterized protein n=1 Tax=Rhizobium fredii TaxID=380 RepID=A0A2L0HBM1_RHIFR|nr:hypothetical protein NXT3_PB00205 [Sinorhizobium fredii]